MANIGPFDANKEKPLDTFDPIPEGKYLAVITESEWKATGNNTGRQLVFTFEIIDGEFKGRKLWSRLNLEHTNQQTVKFARQELSSICRAVGVMCPKDTVELHNIPLVFKVKLKKRDDNGEMSNVVKGYENKQAGVPLQQPATSAASSATPPWKR